MRNSNEHKEKRQDTRGYKVGNSHKVLFESGLSYGGILQTLGQVFLTFKKS